MARHEAIPSAFGEVSKRFFTPVFSTVAVGALAVAWYVPGKLISENFLFDSLTALGLMIAFYYALTGFACVVYYRREIPKTLRNFFFIGLAPGIGAVLLSYIFVKALFNFSDPANSYTGEEWFGVAPPAVIGVGMLLLGVVLLFAWRLYKHEPFFKRRPRGRRPGAARAEAGGRGGGRGKVAMAGDGSETVPCVELRSVTKRFGDLVAVDDLSLAVPEGDFFTLLGPSGCGKTTTLRMVAGFEEATDGRVLIDGEDVAGVPPYKRPTNTVFQSYALFPHLSVKDNVAFGLKRKKVEGAEISKRVDRELERVGLAAEGNRRPAQLSGGQQQRVALARALVNLPKVLLLDEPLGALDLKLRKGLQVQLKQIQRDVGITFLYVTHDQEEALTMSDRIAVMNRGRIEQVADPEEVYDKPATTFVAGFIGVSNLMPGVVKSSGANGEVELDSGVTVKADVDGFAVGDRCNAVVRPRSSGSRRRARRSTASSRASRAWSRAPSTSAPRPR